LKGACSIKRQPGNSTGSRSGINNVPTHHDNVEDGRDSDGVSIKDGRLDVPVKDSISSDECGTDEDR
jgi:hypothetical protein